MGARSARRDTLVLSRCQTHCQSYEPLVALTVMSLMTPWRGGGENGRRKNGARRHHDDSSSIHGFKLHHWHCQWHHGITASRDSQRSDPIPLFFFTHLGKACANFVASEPIS